MKSDRGETGITPFILAMHIAAWVAFAAGWLKGGHTERLGVAVLLSGQVIELFFIGWRIGDFEAGVAAIQALQALIFTRLAFSSDRWWPLAVTGCLILIMMVHLLTLVTSVSSYAAVSAQVGLWLLLHLIVLAGVGERWLAGEAAVSRISRDRARGTV